MHVLILFIFATAEYHHNIVGANGMCDSSPQIDNAMPVTSSMSVKETIRINCTDGYVRKSGTSNLFRCTETNGKPTWTQIKYPLQCIPDPKKPKNPPKTEQNFPTSTTKRAQTSRIPGTSMPSADFGATNEIATSETRTTTTLTTLKMTTKGKELITTTTEVPSSISSICTSRQNLTAKSSPTQSESLTTTTGVDRPSKTTTSETLTEEQSFIHTNKSTIGGTVGVGVILCMTAAVFLLWWRSRHRASNDTNEIQIHHSNNASCTYYIPVPVSDSEHCSAEPNIADAADASTAVSK